MSSPGFVIIVCTVSFCASVTGENTTCPCGWINPPTTNVIGGDDVKDGYPFIASVYKRIKIWKKEPICGATIITSSKVITAAHCVADNSTYYVLAAFKDLSEAGSSDLIPVSDIVTFGFDKTKNTNDIAILTLSIPLNFGSRKIGPVCIPSLKQNILPNVVRVLGWGKSEHKLSGKLQKVDSHVIDIKDCLKEYPNIDEHKQFCTYDKGKGPIKGDSGGPGLWWDPEIRGYTLIGIVSMGPEEEGSIPIIHTLVPFKPYLEFINLQSSGQICSKV